MKSPEPPATATTSTSRCRSPATRAPTAVRGKASATVSANVASDTGSRSRPIRPIPRSLAQVPSSKTSKAGSS